MYREDYQRADVPMLPTKTSPRSAAWWVMLHTLPTGFASLMLVLMPSLGWLYFIPIAIVTANLLRRNIELIKEPSKARARKFFLSTNIYLLLLLWAICFDTVAHAAWASLFGVV